MSVYEAPFIMEEICPPEFPERIFRAEEFVSDGSGRKDDSMAIQRAVNCCAEAGGGTVLITAGPWISGPIHLKSNIRLHLEKDAVVRFSSRYADYLPAVFTRWEGMECYNYSPLIYAYDCENIAITGEGLLLGGGEAWWPWKQLQQGAAERLCYAQSEGIPVGERMYGTETDALRPSFIQPIGCKNVLIEGVTVQDGPQWMLHPVYCENVIVRKVNVISSGPNTDGLNPDSCRNVLIEDCCFDTGDDCIAVNSGMNEDGWRVNRPCENILIRGCRMTGGHGGLTIGSGISGGVRNVYAHGCEISGTNQGIRMKSMRGRGGYVKDIWFEDIVLNGILEEAVQISMYYNYSTVVPKSDAPTRFEGIHLKNIKGNAGKTAVEIRGLPECPMGSLWMGNIRLTAKQALAVSDAGAVHINGLDAENNSAE